MQAKTSGVRPRWSKVLADLWDNKTRTLLVVLSIAVGVFAVGTIANAFAILSVDVDASYAAVNPANITITTESFDDDFLESVERKSELCTTNHESRTLVTGTLFAPILRRVTAHLPGAEVVPVVNSFFGGTVTVAGLLTGQDVVAQLQERELGDVVMLPSTMFGGPEGQTLDGMMPQDVGKALGRPAMVEDA